MNIPGSNLLGVAMSVLARSTVVYHRRLPSVVQANGIKSNLFADPVTDTSGIVQPVPRNVYAQNGLDLQKSYVDWWVQNDVIDLGRANSGDMIDYKGRRYQLMSEQDWYRMDRWTQVRCVDIGSTPNA
jgi:hypothetical protein